MWSLLQRLWQIISLRNVLWFWSRFWVKKTTVMRHLRRTLHKTRTLNNWLKRLWTFGLSSTQEQEYCRTCNKTFCSKCMNKHKKHEFEPLEKRVSELKGKTFEMLNDLDNDEKPLRTAVKKLSKAVEQEKKKQIDLRQHLEKEIEKLRHACLETIDTNCQKLDTDLGIFSEKVDKSVDLQKRFRDLLGTSNYQLLKKFDLTKKDFAENKCVRETLLSIENLAPTSCSNEFITSKFDGFAENLKKNLESTTTIKKVLKSSTATAGRDLSAKSLNVFYICGKGGDEWFKISTGNSRLIVQKIKFTETGPVFTKHCSVTGFNQNIDQCFVFERSRNETIALLITEIETEYFFDEDKTAYTFDWNSKNVQLRKINLPHRQHLLCPYMARFSSHIYWCYWNPDEKLIESTQSDYFIVNCNTLPTVRRNDTYNMDSLIFITDYEVIIADAGNRRFWVIPVRNIYGKISCITAFPNMVIIWCRGDESVLITTRTRSDHTLPLKFKWEANSIVTRIEFRGERIKLRPKWNSFDERQYCFIAQKE